MTDDQPADRFGQLERLRPARMKAGLRRRANALIDHHYIGCPVCETIGCLEKRGPWLREEYVCTICGSLPRMRALMRAIDTTAEDWRTLDIYEAAPAGPLSDRLEKQAPGYVASHYVEPGVDPADIGGRRNEDLRSLSFPDASFDLVITQDVLEHVFAPDRVFAEIARVLRPGGRHAFTVPIYRGPTRERARLANDGTIEYLLEADYHGNPVLEKGSLVVHEWGHDLAERVDRNGPTTTRITAEPNHRFGVQGEFLDVGISRRHRPPE